MLEIILDKHVIFVLMGILTVIGIVSKLIANVTLKQLVRAAGNMNKSTHPLMRLVRAKFEHACMISDTVGNVRVFVDKYLYEYKVVGMKLHSWRRMEKATAGLCLILGAAGALLEYAVNGMGDMVIKTGAAGAGLAILIYLVHLTTDEEYRMEAVQNYMVDYLENVCLHRYEKAYQKEIKVMAPETPVSEFGVVPDWEEGDGEDIFAIENEPETPRQTAAKVVKAAREEEDQKKSSRTDKNDRGEPERPMPRKEVPSPTAPPEITSPTMPEPYEVPDVAPQIQAASADRKARREKEKEEVAKDVLIRQILEEFMA